mmetsp:Transcript_112029/g.313219  ORF Transcript_112029/g.313219 Transcript_112029/m.313219 type:complete len:289 (-) Transcript_112029:57-923(-)
MELVQDVQQWVQRIQLNLLDDAERCSREFWNESAEVGARRQAIELAQRSILHALPVWDALLSSGRRLRLRARGRTLLGHDADGKTPHALALPRCGRKVQRVSDRSLGEAAPVSLVVLVLQRAVQGADGPGAMRQCIQEGAWHLQRFRDLDVEGVDGGPAGGDSGWDEQLHLKDTGGSGLRANAYILFVQGVLAIRHGLRLLLGGRRRLLRHHAQPQPPPFAVVLHKHPEAKRILHRALEQRAPIAIVVFVDQARELLAGLDTLLRDAKQRRDSQGVLSLKFLEAHIQL